MDWKDIGLAPQDGTPVLVTDDQNVWIASQRIGKHAGPSRDGMPTTGHCFPVEVTGWMELPDPKNGFLGR